MRALDDLELRDAMQTVAALGLDAVVETHSVRDVQRALAVGVQIVGINNRDLQDFTVDLDNSARLRNLVPPGVVTVSESGLGGRADIERVAGNGFDACLIGETLLTSGDLGDVGATLRALCGVRTRTAVS